MEECNMDKSVNDWAREVRNTILDLAVGVGKKGIHIGSAMSVVEILCVLYKDVMHYDPKNGEDPERDYFVLSKGHAYTALYAVLCKAGYFDEETLKANFMTDGGLFPVHPVRNTKYGIEFSGGSLGTGISYAVGKALALKKRGKSNRVYCLVGDGECNEGSVWEALMSAAQLKLDNLTVIVDKNGLQQDGPTCETLDIDIAGMAEKAGLYVCEIDGHNADEIYSALNAMHADKPLCIVAHTVKGKGVSFMENNNAYHHAVLNEKMYNQAKEELNHGA